VIRLAIRVQREQAEIVLAELLELAPAGVEEVQHGGDQIEFAVYGAPGELPSLPALDAVSGTAKLEISTTELPDDWHERWKEFHKPVLIESPGAGVALRISPPWEAPAEGHAGRVHEIVVDPGQAFGTGGHASTRMCLALLLELDGSDQKPGALLDVGTGSGVLAIAAGKLGYTPLLALDHERESVEAAGVNAGVNGVELEARHFDLRTEQLPWLGGGDGPDGPVVMMANLLRGLLLTLAGAVVRAPEHLIASGVLREEADEVAGAFTERLGLRERSRLESGDWAAIWMTSA
jgi:ribosomal protein L11 methyltransferase